MTRTARMVGNSDPLPRRDILAICAYLNRNCARPKPVDACERPETALDRIAAAARMQ